MNNRNLYEILMLDKECSAGDIKINFKKLALKYHPDRNNNIDNDQFKYITEAYNILSDPFKRKEYDLKNENFSEDNFDSSDYNHNETYDNKTVDLKKYDINFFFKISLEDIYLGFKNINYDRKIFCSTCKNNYKKCNFCNGNVYILKLKQLDSNVLKKVLTKCEYCNDYGNVKINNFNCKKCEDKIMIISSQSINIPLAINNYKDISLDNKGNQINSDLYGKLNIKMTLKKHKNYDIINNKLFLTKKINLDKILLMEEIIFKHLDKNSYSFKPKNIKPRH